MTEPVNYKKATCLCGKEIVYPFYPQYRKLSDGEIAELFHNYCENDGGSYFEFAKAILERAKQK